MLGKGPLTCTYFVALAERYSQRPDLTRRLDRLNKLAGQTPSVVPQPPTASPRSLRYRLSDTQRQAIVRDYQNGTPTTELTRRFQLGKGTVLKLLEEAGADMRRQGLTGAEITEAVRLYQAGLSLAKIATQLDSAPTTINRALVSCGVRLRGRHDRS